MVSIRSTTTCGFVHGNLSQTCEIVLERKAYHFAVPPIHYVMLNTVNFFQNVIIGVKPMKIDFEKMPWKLGSQKQNQDFYHL